MRFSLIFAATTVCVVGLPMNITDNYWMKVSEENQVDAQAVASSPTRIIKGQHTVKTYTDGEIPLNRKYTKVSKIPKSSLENFNQVFVFSSNHFMIHKTREYRRYYKKNNSPIWDVWVEYKGQLGESYHGEPFAHSVLKTNEAGGSVSIGKSNNFGVTFNPALNFEMSQGMTFLTLTTTISKSLSLTAGFEVGVDASCNVPPNTQGGIFAFDTRTRLSMERREWKMSKGDYVAGKWNKVNTAVRNFDNPIFVCSTDAKYINDLTTIMDDIKPSEDYSGFIPNISGLI